MQGVNKHSKRFIRRNCTSEVFNEEHLKEVASVLINIFDISGKLLTKVCLP